MKINNIIGYNVYLSKSQQASTIPFKRKNSEVDALFDEYSQMKQTLDKNKVLLESKKQEQQDVFQHCKEDLDFAIERNSNARKSCIEREKDISSKLPLLQLEENAKEAFERICKVQMIRDFDTQDGWRVACAKNKDEIAETIINEKIDMPEKCSKYEITAKKILLSHLADGKIPSKSLYIPESATSELVEKIDKSDREEEARRLGCYIEHRNEYSKKDEYVKPGWHVTLGGVVVYLNRNGEIVRYNG